MKRLIVAMAALLLIGSAASAATLSYTLGATNSYDRQLMTITASESGTDIWQIETWVVDTSTAAVVVGHTAYYAGQINSFKDLQYGGTAYNYSGEAESVFSYGLFSWASVYNVNTSGTSESANWDEWSDDRQAAYYEYSYIGDNHCGPTTDPNNLVDCELVVRINAPTVASGGYTTAIDVDVTVTNNSGASQNLWYCGLLQDLQVQLNDAAYAATLANNNGATGGPSSPNQHNTPVTDYHSLYACEDWYGSTDPVGYAIAGSLERATVLNNADTIAENMRAGLMFENKKDDIDHSYDQHNNTSPNGIGGSTDINSGGYLDLRSDERGPSTSLADAAIATGTWQSQIVAPGSGSTPSAVQSRVHANASDPNDTSILALPADGTTEGTVYITVKNAAGDPLAGIAAADVVVATTGSATITQPTSDTDANGRTSCTIKNGTAETVTVTATVQGVPITDDQEVLFSFVGVELQYSAGTGHGSYNMSLLVVTAVHTGVDVWEMGIYTPTTGTDTSHTWCEPGQIGYFKDLDNDPTGNWNYSGDGWNVSGAGSWFAKGIFEVGATSSSGTSSSNPSGFSDTQNAAYYEYVHTRDNHVHLGSATDPNNIIDATVTVRINAPTPVGGGYTTSIAGTVSGTNNQAGSLSTWFGGSFWGGADMDLLSEDGTDHYTGAFVNPNDTAASDKPNVHNTPVTDDSDLYAVSDWYGTTVEGSTGLLMQAEVHNNASTAAELMRPGLKFTLEAPAMDFYYSDLANNMYGSTTFDSAEYVECNVGQPGALGSGVNIDPGATLDMDFTMTIDQPAAGPTLEITGLALDWTWVYMNTQTVTQNRHKSVLTISVNDSSPPAGDYTVNITGGGLEIIPQATGDDLVWNLLGGDTSSVWPPTLAAGNVVLTVEVTNPDTSASDTDTVTISLNKIGDVTEDTFITNLDKFRLIQRLNNDPGVTLPDRNFDMDGDTFITNLDKFRLIQLLNNQAWQ